MLKRYIILLVMLAAPALAAPPYSVTATFTEAAGTVDGYRLYVDGEVAGDVVSGQTLPGFTVDADGVYEFEVRAFNSAGESTGNAIVSFDTAQIPDALPGSVDSLTIILSCDTQDPPTCTLLDVSAP